MSFGHFVFIILVMISIYVGFVLIGFLAASFMTRISGILCCLAFGALLAQKLTPFEQGWVNVTVFSLAFLALGFLAAAFLPCTARAFKFLSTYAVANLAYILVSIVTASLVLAFFPSAAEKFDMGIIPNILSIVLLVPAFMQSGTVACGERAPVFALCIVDRIISFLFYYAALFLITQINSLIPYTTWVMIGMAVGAVALCVLDEVCY